jgi:hypothetical protein
MQDFRNRVLPGIAGEVPTVSASVARAASAG